MTLFEIIILLVVIAGFTSIIIFIRSKKQNGDDLAQVLSVMQQGSKEERKILLDSLTKNTTALNERLDRAAHVIGQVQKNIGEVSEIGRGMKEVQEFLRSPKLRGTIGEQILKELLSQLLPQQSFRLQHQFESGAIVDAAITTASGLIPIDSKFPMENFRNMINAENEATRNQFKRLFTSDVKKHIKDIANKYILAEEGTIDYALMYIPSESVYYEIVNSIELYDYSSKSRVLPVSPTTFYAFLKAILMSFEGQKIGKQAQEILRAFRSVQKDHEKLGENITLLSKHITNAHNTTATVLSQFTMLGQKIEGANKLDMSKQLELKE